MLNFILLLIFSINADEYSTKNYWIKFNEHIHKFNKSVNAKPSSAPTEINYTIAEIRKIPLNGVDSKVIKYCEKRISFALEYSEFLKSLDFVESVDSFKTEYPIKQKKEKFTDMQKRYELLYDKNKKLEGEQEELIAYLKEKYNLIYK